MRLAFEEFEIRGLRFEFWGLRLGVLGFGFGVRGVEFEVVALKFGGFGFGGSISEFIVCCLGLRSKGL